MYSLISPVMADAYWIGGGTLGLVLIVLLIIFLARRV
jgi:hypothetical protein